MTKDRPPSFQWYPRDFAAAMHQGGVTDEVELAYRRALDASWDSGHYGVGTLAQWIEWGRVKAELEHSYSTALISLTQAQADGTLVQMRMVHDRMEQAMRHRSRVKRGSQGGLKSRRRKRVKQSQAELKLNQPLASASASASASALEEDSEQHTHGQMHYEHDVSPQDWFLDRFWPLYPRKVARQGALDAFLAIVRRTAPPKHDDLATDMLAGLERDIRNEWADSPPDKIPHARTWIHQRRWEDQR